MYISILALVSGCLNHVYVKSNETNGVHNEKNNPFIAFYYISANKKLNSDSVFVRLDSVQFKSGTIKFSNKKSENNKVLRIYLKNEADEVLNELIIDHPLYPVFEGLNEDNELFKKEIELENKQFVIRDVWDKNITQIEFENIIEGKRVCCRHNYKIQL